MPTVHVHIWKGFSEEKIKEIIEGITKVFVDMGIPPIAVEVIIHEIPKSHWGIEGKPASESRKDAKPPQ
ncbi:MAG: tautomerase family protein [Candidatus Jordarchaeum sp.]|uniref:tautomerase family protein n=1 Tax=Candidatus Jordarchaeum sp. TaxID=2823881 RepID=UPI004049F39D